MTVNKMRGTLGLTLVLSLTLARQPRPQDSLPRALIGCWTVSLEAWRPVMRLGADTIFSTPPKTIEIPAVRGTASFEAGGWIVRPAPGVRPSIHRFSYLVFVAPDSVRIVWTTGFSGLTMRLGLKGGSLRGTAETFWDFGRPPQVAQATLTHARCP